MSTHDIPDNELDDFFRKSLEKPDIDFREEDWLDMEKKLQTATRRKAVFRRYLYSLLALLMGTAITVVLWVNYKRTENNEATVHSLLSSQRTYSANAQPLGKGNPDNRAIDGQTAEEESTAGSLAPEKTLIRETTPGNKENTVSGLADTQKAIQKENIKTDANKNKTDAGTVAVHRSRQEGFPITERTATQNSLSEDTANDTDLVQDPNKGNIINRRSRKAAAPRISSGVTLTQEVHKPVKKKTASTGKRVVADRGKRLVPEKPLSDKADTRQIYTENTDLDWPVEPVTRLHVKTLFTGDQLSEKYGEELQSLPAAKPTQALPADSAKVKKLARERLNYRWRLSLVVSPDLSAVRFSGLTRPGTNVGVLLSYSLSRKLSLSTGIIRSAKIYDARMEDYSPPPGQWTYYVKPVEIKASCTVLDIPLNLRYNLLMKNNHTVYATAGLSSYLMLSEHYKYIYDVDDTYLRKSWQVDNENKHFFKVYNVSAGYERRLTRRLSAGAEPFLKIPGAGVGFGKIQLWSAGIFVSAHYKLGR
jgi:hypothetical protein